MYYKQLVDTTEIRKLSKIHPIYSILATSLDWGIIILAITISIVFAHPILYIASWMLIGNRMYALYGLLHDGIHYLHLRNKRWNDVFTSIFLAWPLGISLYQIRKTHLKHHKHLQTNEDPEMVHLKYDEFQFPKKPASIFWILIKDITGINFIYYFIIRQLKNISSFFKKDRVVDKMIQPFHTEDVLKWISYIMIGFALIYFGWWKYYILFWLIPYATVYQTLNRIRLSTEHFQMDKDQLFKTRSVVPGVTEKFIFTPHNLGYHTEHHLYPSIPFYYLPELHKLLMEQPTYREGVLKEKSYLKVMHHYIS